MKYKIDVVRIRENSITLNGWAIGKSPDSKATFRVEDEKRQPVKFKHVNTRRDDVSQIYFKKVYDREFGFDIQFPYERGKDYYLLIRCEGRQAKIKYNEELIARRASVAHKRMEKLKDLMNMETVHVAMDFWKEHGLKALVVKSKHKLQGIDNDYDYSEWYELTKPTDEELAEQRKHLFDFEPMLSVVIPAYKTPERYLREMLDSIMGQTYTNWEICVAMLTTRELQDEIIRLKKEKDICILAHAYQSHDIWEVADYVGDSYGLSVQAAKAAQSTVLMCGVRFSEQMLQRSEESFLKRRLVVQAVNQSVSLLFFHRSGLSDFDFTVVKAFDDGKRFYMDALAAQLVTTMLEGFLYDESHAHQFRASLLHQVHKMNFVIHNWHSDGWWNYCTWRVDNSDEPEIFGYYGKEAKYTNPAWTKPDHVGDNWAKPTVNVTGNYKLIFDAHLERAKLIPAN